MGEVVALPPKPKEGIRYVSVVDCGAEFIVGITYWNGDYVFAGIYFNHVCALDVARQKAASLGADVADFTFAPLGGAA